MRLLDLGCGFAKYHKNYFMYDEIIGIDNDVDCIDFAIKENPNNIYYCYDACDDLDKVIDGKFDCVLSLDVLEHVRRPRNLIENMIKYVNDTGYCYIISPSALAYEINFRFHKGQNKINKPTMQYLTPCVVKGIINRLGGKIIWQSLSCRYWVRPIRIKFKGLHKG